MLELNPQDIQLGEMRLGYYHSASDWQWNPQFKDYDLWYCLNGRGNIIRNGKTLRFEPGICFLFRPGESVRAQSDAGHPKTNFFAHFICTVESIHALSCITERGIRFTNPSGVEALMQLATEAVGGPNSAEPRMVNTALLLLLQFYDRAHHSPLSAPREAKLSTLLHSIRSRPWEEWRIESMAHQVGVSIPHLNRLVKSVTGYSPRHFVIQARCDLARLHLRETSATVEEIAYGLGYRDIYFFSRQFKQITGVPPSHYRVMPETDSQRDFRLKARSD